MGDFNAQLSAPDDSAALLLNAGFFDAWSARYPGTDGFTCCHPPDLTDPYSSLEKQIDFVFARGPFAVRAADIVGDEYADFMLAGRWPSDHAGIVATLLLENE